MVRLIMKYKIGEFVCEGGPEGSVVKIIDYKDGLYVLSSNNGNCIGYLEEVYLYPFKQYEQLSLF